MKNEKLIQKLKTWVKKEGNSYAKLASLLGYKTSTAVAMWINRGEIPHYQQCNVERILKNG